MEIEVSDAASAQTLGRTITKFLEGLDKGGENTAAAWGGGSLTGKMDTNHVAPRKLNQSESSRLRSLNVRAGGRGEGDGDNDQRQAEEDAAVLLDYVVAMTAIGKHMGYVA